MDEFLEELKLSQALWWVKLSDGSIITQDDNRPGLNPASAWIRLGQHIRNSGLSIVKMWLQFRDNIHRHILPENAQGYYFINSMLAMMGGSSMGFYIVGALVDGKLKVQKWNIPALIKVEEEERDPKTAGLSLIINPPFVGYCPSGVQLE